MLALSVVEEIGRLLDEGKLSQRKISARLGVSRGTVGAIASGRRGMYGKEPQADGSEPLVCRSPSERCCRCGYRVSMPCLVCRTRQYRERQLKAATSGRGRGLVPRLLPIHPAGGRRPPRRARVA
jgi:hypothetical protein